MKEMDKGAIQTILEEDDEEENGGVYIEPLF